MKLPLIDKACENNSNEILKSYYKDNLLPPEKKNYLTNLEKSSGPYLAIETKDNKQQYLMDAASQIATLGLGFSPSVFFGTAHYRETWLNNKETKEFAAMRVALESFLQRKSSFKNLDLTLCNSGAEANEIALGYCYRTRHHRKANKVLAFEGSFHGRMMITLASTWNKVKREPFEYPEHETIYCKFPELENDKIHTKRPKGWQSFWENSSSNDLEIPSDWEMDSELKLEINCLLGVKDKLKSNEVFSIIVEPMQCEGGDRYSSSRFNEALILLAHSYHVKVIHDEVQTGFHLGKEFFWHREFKMTDSTGEILSPDYVVCAKKSQVGMVLAHESVWGRNKYEEFSVASTLRGYLHAVALDQAQSKIVELEELTRAELEKFCNRFEGKATRARVNGMAFAFEVPSNEETMKFIAKRFDHGLLYYPAGAKTLRFRLNTSYTKSDIQFLFERLTIMADNIFNNKEETYITEVETRDRQSSLIYEWHKLLVKTKLRLSNNQRPDTTKLISSIHELFSKSTEEELFVIDKENFETWKSQIEDLQKAIYEPTRQTDIKKFEQSASNENSVAIGVKSGNKLLAMAFSSPLSINPLERGVRVDPYLDNEKVLYMVDSTVSKELQGKGIGRVLKYALTAFAMTKGIERIHGRNRDRMAASMLNINLSLGAYELMFMREDYPDFEEYRDVFYYTTKASWSSLPISLSNGIQTPLSLIDLTEEYIETKLPNVVNKVCLSNFVSQSFLENIKELSSNLPKELQHVYTTSGQSECVDKLAKTIWYTSEKKCNKMITFEGHFFGAGSFLSRSLSYNKDKFFDVTHVTTPDNDNDEKVLKEVEDALKNGYNGGVWIEPISQKTMKKLSTDFLAALKTLCHKYNTKLIFNETASSMYRYSGDEFFASCLSDITPDAGMCFLGGQGGLCFQKEENFIDKPLMLISTWDGDELAFSSYNYAHSLIKENMDEYNKCKVDFTNKLTDILSSFDIEELEIENANGYFIGNISKGLQKYFRVSRERYIVCPSYGQMKRFLAEYK
jgi:acetylornithine/succinyldiaminopimelate/putrescine aminotransferase